MVEFGGTFDSEFVAEFGGTFDSEFVVTVFFFLKMLFQFKWLHNDIKLTKQPLECGKITTDIIK